MNETYIVRINQSIRGPMMLYWRKPHGSRKFMLNTVPYKLASFLRLMPLEGSWTLFGPHLYDFTNKELMELKPDGENILRVTKYKNGVLATVRV